MLYDIYAFECHGEAPTVSQVTLGSGVPPTTALRHLMSLQERGLIERRADAFDRRKVLLQLTQDACKLVTESLTRELVELRRITR